MCSIKQGKPTTMKNNVVPQTAVQSLCVWCVCVCVFSSHSFWTSSSLDVPAGVTQEEGHTGFIIHLLSAVRALSKKKETKKPGKQRKKKQGKETGSSTQKKLARKAVKYINDYDTETSSPEWSSR